MKTLKDLPKICALLIVCLFSLNVHAGTESNFVINGTIKNMKVTPVKVYLYMEAKLADSAAVSGGKYRFSGTINNLTYVKISGQKFIKPGNYDFADILVDKGTINIVCDGAFAKFTVSGPGAQAERDYKEAVKQSIRFADSLKVIGASEEFQTNKELQRSVQAAAATMFKPMTNQIIAFVKTHPQSPAGPEFISFLAGSPFCSASLTDSLLRTLPIAQQNASKSKIMDGLNRKKEAELLKANAQKKTGVGAKAQDFTSTDTNGKAVALSSFRGKYVLIDFWASWCAPCRAENPNIVKAYNAYKDKGFTILGVSLDGVNAKEAWLAAIKKDGLTWTQVSDLTGWKSATAQLYGVTAIPQNFLVDPNGLIIGRNLRAEDLQAKLASLFDHKDASK